MLSWIMSVDRLDSLLIPRHRPAKKHLQESPPSPRHTHTLTHTYIFTHTSLLLRHPPPDLVFLIAALSFIECQSLLLY